MAQFIGRADELKELKRSQNKNSASLIVVRGRRRIGKSRLIAEFAKDFRFLSFAGITPHDKTTKSSELVEFSKQFSRETGLPQVKFDDWGTAFFYLARETNSGQVAVLLDEISWMGSKDPDFLGKLKHAWDTQFKKNNKLILVLCGSASSWIDKNILSNTGFMGRVSKDICLEELPLTDCLEFWPKDNYISSYEKLKLLAVTGGVPRYLEEIDPKLSAEDNIKNMCFTPDAILVKDFNQIFNDLFLHQSDVYKKVVRTLANGAKESTKLMEILGIKQSGRISRYIKELMLAGFIRIDHSWDIKTGQDKQKTFTYRLSDNYLRFYLKYIEKNVSQIQRNLYKYRSLAQLPEWHTMLGLQFENLVLNNRALIWQYLEISPEMIVVENPYIQRARKGKPGCQIDYMIQAQYDTLFLVEIKFSKNEIGTSVIDEVKQKINRLERPTSTSVRPVLIHVNGVSKAVLGSGYFTKIINYCDVVQDASKP